MITAELAARAIIASAVSLGEIKPLEMRSKLITPNAYLPAAVAVAMEVKRPLTDVCRILRIDCDAVALARRADLERFRSAQAAASEAIRYHLTVQAEKAARAAPVAPVAAIPPAPPPEPPKAAPARPARAPAPIRARPPAGRAMPKGARFESLGNGVSVIRLKPITESIARHAKQQIDRGADLDEVADLFDVPADSLKRRIEEMKA